MADPGRAISLFAAPHRITVVCGLPRAGTSLLMQILEAAALPIARDDVRPADADNPRGYFELAAVKAIRRDAGFLGACRGRVVKIVSPLVSDLPSEDAYRFLFVERDLAEVLASQRTMLRRRGAAAPSSTEEAELARAYHAATARARAWIDAAPDAPSLGVAHAELLASPAREIERIAAFLERTGDGSEDERTGVNESRATSGPGSARIRGEAEAAAARAARRRELLAAMTAVVDPALYRSRAGS